MRALDFACVAAAFAAPLLFGCNQRGASPQTAVINLPAAQSQHSAAATPATSEAQDTVPTRSYQDTANGVSFRYPVVWTTAAGPQGYLPAMIQSDKVQIRQAVIFSSKGNFYEKTNLQNLAFTYGLLKAADATACRSFVVGQPTGATPPQSVTVSGVVYTEMAGGDAAMSHRLSSTIDSTFAQGKCFVFERDEMTLAPGVQQGTRALTATEEKALQGHLNDVFRSVRVPQS